MSETILVTGGAGFIGSHLVRRLLTDYPQSTVISLDNYFTGRRSNHLDHPRVTYIDGSTVDIKSIWEKRGDEPPGFVFHLGEYSRIPQSLTEPDLAWEFNMLGTKEVVDFCHQSGAKLVYAGSSSKFGNHGQDENLNPYAWTKAKNAEYIKNHSSWFGLDFVITYFYNVYGPGQISTGHYATVLGIFEEQYQANRPLSVVLPGTQTRDFTHIDDIVSGILLCAEKGAGDGYMIGSGQEYSILSVAEMFGTELEMIPAKPGERARSLADPAKMFELGWRPTVSLPAYVRQIVDRHRSAQI